MSDAAYIDAVAAAVQTHYSLGAVVKAEPFPGAHQRRHHKVIVHTSMGRFLAKTYTRDLTVIDALHFQHRLSEHLHKRRLPVARIQRARDGRRIVELERWALELQEYIDGEPLMTVSARTIAIAGATMGRFHVECRDLPRPPRDALIWRFSEVPRETFGALYKRARVEGDAAEATEQCNRIALFLHNGGKELSLENRDRFETGLIHGDWHGGNLLFRGDALAAIVDLEFAGEGCYLEDLAYGLSNLCIRTTTDPDRLEERTALLLNAYTPYRSLSYYEEVALYYAVGIKQVATVSYQMPQMNWNLANHGASEWLRRLDLQCAWLRERAESIRSGRR